MAPLPLRDKSAAVRPAAYLAALVAIFGGALAVGSAVGDSGDDQTSPAGHSAAENDMAGMGDDGHGAAEPAGPVGNAHGEHGAAKPTGSNATTAHGLGVAENGLRLVAPATARANVREPFAFRVVDQHGATVRDFATEHTKRLHLIAVRRDLTGFQHLHPRQAADGTWTCRCASPDAGAYRVFADFRPDGERDDAGRRPRGRRRRRPAPLPAPADRARVDGYDVALRAGAPRAGARRAALHRHAATAGRSPSQPYLGAGGHLVALREGDLAYLHVHPRTATPSRAHRVRRDVPDRRPLPPVPAVPGTTAASTPSPSPRRSQR